MWATSMARECTVCYSRIRDMASKQSKRRRKKYEPGSAYAGDVKPTGVLGFLSSASMIKIIFIGMAFALGGAGLMTIFGGNVLFRGNSSNQNFVRPEDQRDVGDASATPSEFTVKQYASPPALAIDANETITATIRTPLGDIDVELLPKQALETVNNFVFLAQDGFYDGLKFQSVTSGFSAQAGDPACSVEAPASLCRKNGGPGYELNEDVSGEFTAGTLGMVNGSQFFIALKESPQFDGFTPFGSITSGLDVAEQITTNTPIESIEISIQ